MPDLPLSVAIVKVTRLSFFPVKSYKAVNLTIDEFGVVGNRRFMLVDAGGQFISQRIPEVSNSHC